MLSRVADSLYWMSRNIERAENNAKVASLQFIQMLEASEDEMRLGHEWEKAFEICCSLEELAHIRQQMPGEGKALIHYLTFADQNRNSIVNCVRVARENARVARDHLPGDLWEIWNDLYLYVNTIKGVALSPKDINQFYERMRLTALTAQGAIEASMSRGVAYRFIKIGKWLERAEKTARILHVASSHALRSTTEQQGEALNWQAALKFVNGYEAYLQHYSPDMHHHAVVQFLFAEESFPKSVRYCMNRIRESIQMLEKGKVSHYSWRLYASLDELAEEWDEVRLETLSREEVVVFLERVKDRCNEIGRIFARTYYLVGPVAITEKWSEDTVLTHAGREGAHTE
ncbi:MAG: alpha-E domain-containing protein [Gorillibacterium sp.]|nr:alpha-E domain-containing protein [Gorillibacterium sp.]